MSVRNLVYLLFTTLGLISLGWVLNSKLVNAQVLERIQQSLQSEIGNGFTYQGYLDDGGNPANGSYDFAFALFDVVSGGTQVGSVQSATLNVADGVFMVQLNGANEFGTNAFDGSARFLEIRVWDVDNGEFVILTPRQALTAVPYAHFAQKTQPLANVITVAKSGGDYTTINDALNAITDASADNPYLIHIAPGIYNEQVLLKSYVHLEGSGENITIIRSMGGNSSPNTTGTGATLRASGNIVAEVRFLTIESIGTSYATAIWTYSVPPGTLKFTHITAKATTSGYMSVGILNNNASPTMQHVTALATNATTLSHGVYNIDSAAPEMSNMTIMADGSQHTTGIFNDNGSPVLLRNSTISSSGGAYAYGIRVDNSSATLNDIIISVFGASTNNQGLAAQNSPVDIKNATINVSGGEASLGIYLTGDTTMSNVSATSKNGSGLNTGLAIMGANATLVNVQASASGNGAVNRGIQISSSDNTIMNDVIATATGGTIGYGIYNAASNGSWLTLENVTASATAATNNYGLYNLGNTNQQTILIEHSHLIGSLNTIRSDSAYSIKIGSSKLEGGDPVANGGSFYCLYSYDEAYTALNSSCGGPTGEPIG